MALRAKLEDVIHKKPEGDDWYCFQVPEEYHVWTSRHKWSSMEQYGVAPIRLKVSGAADGNETIATAFTKKNPKTLVCGVEVAGRKTTNQSQSFSWDLRVDSVREINDALSELAEGDDYQVNAFNIRELDVFNKKTGVILKCERHNPDGNQTSLYIVGFHDGGELRLYPEVALATMQQYVADFKSLFAQCSNIQAIQHGCVVKNKIKKKQIKLRKQA